MLEFQNHQVLTRDFKPVKPHPAAIIHIAEKWNTEPKALMMIGDDKNDINCGNAAGASIYLSLILLFISLQCAI